MEPLSPFSPCNLLCSHSLEPKLSFGKPGDNPWLLYGQLIEPPLKKMPGIVLHASCLNVLPSECYARRGLVESCGINCQFEPMKTPKGSAAETQEQFEINSLLLFVLVS